MASQNDYIRTALRVPPVLHAKIHESAKESGRTFNAEILNRLFNSFGPAHQREVAPQELMQKLIFELTRLIEFAGEKQLDLEYYQTQHEELITQKKTEKTDPFLQLDKLLGASPNESKK